MAKDAQAHHNLQKLKNNYQSVQNHLEKKNLKNFLKSNWSKDV